MEHENEIQYLGLKNFYNLLIDMGLNVSAQCDFKNSINIDFNMQFESIADIDNFLKEFQNKNNIYLFSRNDVSSSNLLIVTNYPNLSNTSAYKFDISYTTMFKKMFEAIDLDLSSLFMINLNTLMKRTTKINELLNFFVRNYLTHLKPLVVVNMCSKNEKHVFMEIEKFIKSDQIVCIPHPSEIILNSELKRKAWSNLKTLKAKLNEI